MAILALPTLRIESQLVEVPVVVRDRKTGKSMEALTARDFILLEAGKPQRIEFLSAYQFAIILMLDSQFPESRPGLCR
jgi:hypothetical protein